MAGLLKRLNVLYCHGLGSSIDNRHGTQLLRFLQELQCNFERLVYRNPGSETHVWNVSEWRDDIERRIGGENWVLMATSAGAHCALNVARNMPDNVKGLFLFCPATSLDFSYVENIAPGALQTLIEEGELIHPPSRNGHPALVSIGSIQEFLNTCVSREPGRIDVRCPVVIVHGTEDELVPFENSVSLSKRLVSNDVCMLPIKGAGHYFDIDETVKEALKEFLHKLAKASEGNGAKI